MTRCIYHQVLLILITLITDAVTESPNEGQTPCLVQDSFKTQLNNTGVFNGTIGAGRVEICYCTPSTTDCYWQTVSTGSNNDPFSWKNSIVVCRELEYFDVQSPILQNTIPLSTLAPSSVSIYSTTFSCDGTESSLSECATDAQTDSETHRSDAYVTCQISVVFNNKVRLVGSTTPNEGAVQIYRSQLGGWATVCPNSWTQTEADILCKSLGYDSGIAKNYIGPYRGSAVNTNPSISSISCTGTTLFSACTFIHSSFCPNNDGSALAGAMCIPENGIADGSVRLYNVSTEDTYNRVEVYYADRWGTVCDMQWDASDGEVACRELGRGFSNIPSSATIFNSLSSRPIFVSGYNCQGNESNISSCLLPSLPIGFTDRIRCSHLNDAGLECESNGGDSSVVTRAVSSSIFVISFILFALFFLYIFCIRDWLKGNNVRLCDCLCGCLESCCNFFTDCNCDCITCPTCPTGNGSSRQQQSSLEMEDATPTVVSIQPRSSSSSSSSSDSSDRSENSLADSLTMRRELNRFPDLGQSTELTENELTKNAPPTYSDALQLGHVKPPPEYIDDTPITNDNILPYPIQSDYNPAYPPSLPILLPPQADYHGYPQPTVPHSPENVTNYPPQ